ncbi:MAG: division/cell wall cluster transcriptional repressor MraZ [Pseudomonadota bacterium]
MLRSAEALFLGSHTNKIDAKGRIAAPAEFRKALDLDAFSGFVCVPSLTGPFLDCGGLDLLARLQARIDSFDPYDPDRDAMEIALMGRARKLPLDKDGRTILPKVFVEHANLDGEACFVGRGDYFQIWNVADIEERFAQAAKRAKEARFSTKARPAPAEAAE